MKITIDLNDPEIQKQIHGAIDAKLHEIAAERIGRVVDNIVATKMARLTDQHIDKLANAVIDARIKNSFEQSFWNQPSEFQKTLASITERMLREKMTK